MTAVAARRAARALGAQDAAPRRAEPGRARRLRRDDLPRLLDGLHGVQAGRRDHELHAEVDPGPPDARPLHRRDPHARTSGPTCKNSVIVVVVVVALSVALAFLAAVALAKFRFTGRKAFIVLDDRDPDAPGERADHPALRRARPLPPGRTS